jgi:tetratricopeptide (TPR) repeat protein
MFQEKQEMLAKVSRLWSRANSLRDKSQHEEALPLFQNCLKLRTIALGAHHADTMIALMSTAGSLMDLKLYADVLPLYKQAIPWLSNFPKLLCMTEKNMGVALYELNRYEECLGYITTALENTTRQLGQDHAATVASLNIKANALVKLKRSEEAVPLFKRLLKQRRRLLGDDHDYTLDTMNNLGLALINIQQYGGAIKYFSEAERRSGSDEAASLSYQHNKAAALELSGRDDDALQLYTSVLEKQRQVIGNDHEETMNTMNNVGYVLFKLQRHAEALEYYNEAIERRTRVLGADHADSASSVKQRAVVLAELGRAA